MASFQLEISGLADATGTLNKLSKAMDRVMRRTVDQSMSQARANAVKAITDETTLRPAKVKKRIVVIKRTRPNDYTSEMLLLSGPFALKDFQLDVNTQTGAVRADIGPGGPKIIEGAFWPGRTGRKGGTTRKRKPGAKRWNKKQIFERIPARLSGRDAYRVPAKPRERRVGRLPIRLAIVPGVVDIVERQLESQLNQLSTLLGQKFSENYDVELRKFGARTDG
jgi:hypothetical protein